MYEKYLDAAMAQSKPTEVLKKNVLPTKLHNDVSAVSAFPNQSLFAMPMVQNKYMSMNK